MLKLIDPSKDFAIPDAWGRLATTTKLCTNTLAVKCGKNRSSFDLSEKLAKLECQKCKSGRVLGTPSFSLVVD